MAVDLLPPPFALGGLTVRRVMEMQMPFRRPAELFPNADPDDIAALAPEFTPWALARGGNGEPGAVIIAVQSYLVRTSHHTILIDTCVGCDKTNLRIPVWHGRTDRSWLDRLRAAGVAPEEVDYVFCTHLHADHCGWNTQLQDGRWVPTFPNAKYVFSKAELAHAEAVGQPQYAESVLPVVEAGQALVVESDFALDDEVRLEPTPGHTPGHVAVRLEGGAARGIMWGDVIHSPMQCLRPDWHFFVDADREQAVATRRRVLAMCAEEGLLALPAHFPAPSAGRVRRDGDAFRFHYEIP